MISSSAAVVEWQNIFSINQLEYKTKQMQTRDFNYFYKILVHSKISLEFRE